MKKLFPLIVLALSACTSIPVPPSPTACSNLGEAGCGTPPARHSRHAGLSADKTVMRMVQSPTLIGGKAAEPAEWPASVYARAGNAACSATLVGDRVLFMASHCMDDGGRVTFTAHANSYIATCTHHPDYNGNNTADWALCLVDRPVVGVPFEVMGVQERVSLADTLTLSGYGCIKPGGGGGNDGIFRVGEAIVKGLPSGTNYDIVTKGGAALCFGDSGGSAYAVKPDGTRRIIGVNSRGDIATMSYLPAVYSGSFQSWATTWARVSNNVRICGVHSDAMGCRSGEPKPQPDGKFEVSTKAACVRGVVSQEALSRKDDVVLSVRKALEQF